MKKALSMLPMIFIFVGLFMVHPDDSYGEMYQWTDKSGKSHYTDHPGNIPEMELDRTQPIKGVFGTPDPKQYHKNDLQSKLQRKEEFRQNVERNRKVRACERSCQRKNMFDTVSCIQSKCRSIR